MAWLFRTPVRQTDGPRVPSMPNPKTDFDDGGRGNNLLRYVRRPAAAVCVIIDGAGVHEKQSPTQVELAAATFHYLGGHDYLVSDAERLILLAAGYEIITV